MVCMLSIDICLQACQMKRQEGISSTQVINCATSVLMCTRVHLWYIMNTNNYKDWLQTRLNASQSPAHNTFVKLLRAAIGDEGMAFLAVGEATTTPVSPQSENIGVLLIH